MGDLSQRFSRKEFSCKCNFPECRRTPVDSELIINLEKCADYFLTQSPPDTTRVIAHINSGYRCQKYDIALKTRLAKKKGVKYTPRKLASEHLFGWAADFRMEWEFNYYDDESGKLHREKIPDDDIADYLEMEYVAKHGIGRYKGRTHYDVRSNGPARWDNR